ncbi:hypothetical protein STAFG_0227 [Streptomyces afghaniensis 772]|uniref:Uncharacterized protein n=1 Tax=Streptomyces afghaniensis 772 TaxID=1283301 RepID=S4NVX4_9ACTN|nr:hypothetical protein STAFG_0227 [Streptomyces afghaniensis 772]
MIAAGKTEASASNFTNSDALMAYERKLSGSVDTTKPVTQPLSRSHKGAPLWPGRISSGACPGSRMYQGPIEVWT